MNAKILEARRSADLYIATGTPVAASLVISICDQLDEAKESINALTLALEVERDAANLYAKQVAHWIGRYDALLEQQLAPSVPQEWNDKNVMAWCVARGIKEAQPSEPAQPEQWERAEVIERLEYVAKNGVNSSMRELARKAADLLQSAQPVAQPNIQNQIVKDISEKPCHACAHYQQGKRTGVSIHDETCYGCSEYYANKWEAA